MVGARPRRSKLAPVNSRHPGIGLIVLAGVLAQYNVAQALQIEPVAIPTPDGALGASVVFSGDDLVLSWVEKDHTGSRLMFSIAAPDGAFGRPRQIAAGNDWFVNWADFPAIAVNGDLWAAHWLARLGESTYAYGVRTVVSSNRGASWSSVRWLHDDRSPTEHGFVSYFPDGAMEIGAAWLDGRATTQNQPMTLRTTTLAAGGATAPEQLIDASTCDCCQTDAAFTSRGPLVVWRNRSEGEIRDIFIARRDQTGWSEPRAVARDEWKISACPVNGPALAARDDGVAVAWFTAAQERPRVLMARSRDAGAHFAAPLQLAAGDALGRVDAVALDAGRVAVSYVTAAGMDATIWLALVDAAGAIERHPIGSTSAARSSGFPRLAYQSGHPIWLVWRELGENEVGTIRLTRITL